MSPASPAMTLGAACARPGPLVRSAVCAPLITHRHSLLGVVCDCAIHSSELCAARGCLRVVRLARVAHRRRASLWLATWLRRDSPRARRRVVGSTCGSVSLLAPCTRGVLCAPLLLSLTALYHLRCAPRVARGGSLPLPLGVAFGVPRVPRGYLVAPSVSQCSVEPVSVDIIYLHPSTA